MKLARMPTLKSIMAQMAKPKVEKSPLDDIPRAGDVETDSKAELTELQKGFAKRRQEEAKRRELATDSEYWCCLCFSSREQKEAFLQQTGLLPIGDKYLDGYKVAEKFGVNLPEVEF